MGSQRRVVTAVDYHTAGEPFRIARDDLERLQRQRDRVIAEIDDLQREQDRLLDRMLGSRA